MGTRIGPRAVIPNLKARLILNGGGPIAQVLHPAWIARGDTFQMADVLIQIESLLAAHAAQVQLVLTGGGFVEIWLDTHRTPGQWRSEAALRSLAAQCGDLMAPVFLRLRGAPRDYLVGVDFISQNSGVGQFAALGHAGHLTAVVWKSFPVGTEGHTLAGFGTEKGRTSPRVTDTALGRAVVLVCHDAQAFNHRNIALVGRASTPTDRSLAMTAISRLIDATRPPWALNLIHVIEKPSSMTTFHRSLKQFNVDHDWRPRAVGAFGYGSEVRSLLASLAGDCQYPPRSSRCIISLEP